MRLNQKMMKSLAAIAVIMSVMIMETNGEKVYDCCTSVSTKKITSPITGFILQSENLPCVKAVIFFTSEGAMCSHWRKKWVREKIWEFRKLQGLQMNSTVSTPLSTSSPLKRRLVGLRLG